MTEASMVTRIATLLGDGRQHPAGGATVLLGAGASHTSGVPDWPGLAAKLCVSLALEGSDPIATLGQYFEQTDADYPERKLAMQAHLSRGVPSRGYAHLAELISEGFVSTILTTNWDSLLEESLYKLMSPQDVRVMVRGDSSDEQIARALRASKRGARGATVVKLHGDLQTGVLLLSNKEMRRFPSPLGEALSEVLSGLTMIVGQSMHDVDTMSAVLQRNDKGTLYVTRHNARKKRNELELILGRAGAQFVEGMRPSLLAPKQKVNLGSFDDFFTQVNLAVQRRAAGERQTSLVQAERSILDKEKSGLGYINYSAMSDLVESFAGKVRRESPEAVFFVNDPTAPGGMELRRRMEGILTVPVFEIRVEGRGNTRSHKRRVTSSPPPALSREAHGKLLVLDAITFSGNTLRLAESAVREWYPFARVQLGVLVISQQLLANEGPESWLHETVTDRFEIFFPWGVTQLTAAFDRRFMGADDEAGRVVKVSRRPWGAIEIFADAEVCSARLLTIEAQQRLSFQRHLCRDELFVALDDNIGLDICGSDLADDVDEFDPRIKSLILEKGDYVLVPRGVWHRTKASMDRVRLLEVAFGVYDQANDIERLFDSFDRAGSDGSR